MKRDDKQGHEDGTRTVIADLDTTGKAEVPTDAAGVIHCATSNCSVCMWVSSVRNGLWNVWGMQIRFRGDLECAP